MRLRRGVLLFLIGLGLNAGCFNLQVGDQDAKAARLASDSEAISSTAEVSSPASESDAPSAPAPAPVETPASEPEPAAPSGTAGSWVDWAAQLTSRRFLGAEHEVVFYALDTLAHPKEAIHLTARLQTDTRLADIPGVTVGFYQDANLVASALTNDQGLASVPWTPPQSGNFLFTARIVKVPDDLDQEMLQVTPAPLLVCARDEQTRFVIIDLDHTVVESGFFRVLVGGAGPMPDSIEVTNRLAGTYSIIYLTQRPDMLTYISKNWLRDHGYPLAPLLMSQFKQAIGGSGPFKTAAIAQLKKNFPALHIGIGDKLSDAQAYADNGMTAYLIPHYKQKPKDMFRIAEEIRALRGQNRLQVVSDWRQIEAGIFEGRRFPPAAFARQLEQQARRFREEDDDDD